jgi:hypothetical protein
MEKKAMKKILAVLFITFICSGLTGCATSKKVLPLHDEVLSYELPYDLTDLRTLDALNAQDGWQLEATDKEKGMIRIRNVQYTRLNDRDRRVLTFTITRVDRRHTSVALAPESQRTLSGGDMLKAISARLKNEL